MKKYKLTNQNLQTHNGCQWQIGVEKETSGTGNLCSEGWLHYYHHPLLAIFLNPIHANISDPKLFEIKALGKCKDDHGLKGGCTKQTLMKEIPLPVISITQKIAFAILCSLSVYSDPTYKKWADDWLSGKDRTYKAATRAAYAAHSKLNLIKLAKKAMKL